MFLPSSAPRLRRAEAEAARRNRREIVKALSQGQVSRRDLFNWGIFTATGLLSLKNGLSPFAQSAVAGGSTDTLPSPTFGARKFTQALPRAVVAPRVPMQRLSQPGDPAAFPFAGELPARRLSYHDDFSNSAGQTFRNPVTGRGPIEGRPPGEFFAHQRWTHFHPKVGVLLSAGQVRPGTRFAPGMPDQDANSIWSFGSRQPGATGQASGLRTGSGVPLLVKARYGEPMLTRIYNDLPVHREDNNGFGRNELSTHLHNAHNGAESDGACNAYHFPGTFYDYLWSTALARRDEPAVWLRADPDYARKASGPNDGEGLVQLPGDFREIQGSMWFHDHRFFFTAENVYKGSFSLFNMYSGPDRAREDLDDGINLRLPSGSRLAWGNTDFDVNLAVSNVALDRDGQLFYDVFETDGFLGDILAVNGAYYPYLEVLPRRYRFRLLNAAMSRFIKLALAVNSSARFASGTSVPFHFIANDGNFVVSPLRLTQLDEQGPGERYDIIVDFAAFSVGDRVQLVNLLQQTSGNKPDGPLSIGRALAGSSNDPAVGAILEFRVVDALQSVDDPGKRYNARVDLDQSVDLGGPDWVSRRKTLTAQIPIVAPVRERVMEFGKSGGGDSRDTADGQCIPECGEIEKFPWSIKINGQAAHTLNANRISALIPRPGEVEHWTLINGGGGWDHPMHLHFEEGVFIDRGGASMPATERLARKDIFRLRPGGRVKFQVRFSEFGGAYVNHCHNTVHEDFAMLMRVEVLTPAPDDPNFKGQPQFVPSPTPIPTADGVEWKLPEILPEGDPS